MKTQLFDFNLPEELIAQKPSDKRENAKLLLLDRSDDSISDHHFYNIVDLISKNSVLVLNDTKVIPARLFGTKDDTNANIELLLLTETVKDTWEALVKPAKKVNLGTVISVYNQNGKKVISFKCIEKKDEGICVFETSYDGIFLEKLDEVGTLPLPPYIHEKLSTDDRYQTVYANLSGSAAAPTAGFHFTKEIIKELAEKGVEIVYVTLHVGLSTFRPVKESEISNHQMHYEKYIITDEAAKTLNKAKKNNKKIIAVGTTSVRTLESNYVDGKFHAGEFNTNIFIYPGYTFKVVNEIITNFHLPKSTLVMLISAFYERNKIINAYNYAIGQKYRFFSFGDSMYIK